jgi:TonB family protein
MQVIRSTVLALCCSLWPLSFVNAADPLAEARRLYASRQYEHALAELTRVGSASPSEQADEYRVLCLLGLGRAAEAERVIERHIARRPLATIEPDGRAPQFVTLYEQVRRRMLPLVAQTLYGSAKASLDDRKVEVARAQFSDLLELLRTAPADAEGLNDLRLLADGFVWLLEKQRPEARLARALPVETVFIEPDGPGVPSGGMPHAATADVSAAPAAIPRPTSQPFAPWRPMVYGLEHPDVIPPTTIAQTMPVWAPPPAFADRTIRGTLAIVVAEDGTVASAEMTQRAFPLYDHELLRAARQWQYKPALKDGKPVRYRKTIDVTLKPAK